MKIVPILFALFYSFTLFGQKLTVFGPASMNGEVFKLYSFENTYSKKLIDSTKMENGFVKFNLSFNDIDYYMLTIENNSRFLPFIGDKNTRIKVKSVFIDESIIENSPENNLYLDFNNTFNNKFSEIMNPIYVKIEEAKHESNLENLEFWQKKKREAYGELMQYIILYIQNNPDSFVSLLILEKYWNDLQYKDLLKLIESNLKQHYRYKKLIHSKSQDIFMNKMSFLSNFSLKDLNGETITKSDFNNKILLIDFWGTWCVPCLELIPDIIDLHDKYQNNKLVSFLSIAYESNDDTNRLKRIISRHKLSGIHVLDSQHDSKITKELGINVFPTFVIINEKSEIAYIGVGSHSWSEVVQELNKVVEKSK